MALWLRILLTVLAFIVVVSFIRFLIGIKPFKISSDRTPADYGLSYDNVSFETKDGVEIAGWFIPAEKDTDRAVVVGHGYPFDKSDILPVAAFLQKEFNLLYIDLRSFGDSEGSITSIGKAETQDIQTAVDWLRDVKQMEQVGVFGYSMSASAALMADKKRVDAIVADSPYYSLRRVIEDLYRWVGPFKKPFVWMTALYTKLFLGFWPAEASPAEAVNGARTPILIIQGTADTQIPPGHTDDLYSNGGSTVEILRIEGAGHGETHKVGGEQYRETVTAFFKEQME